VSSFIYCYAECRYAECHYAECRYAECHYAECRYAECRGAILITLTSEVCAIKLILFLTVAAGK
jgi:hypothetical protein